VTGAMLVAFGRGGIKTMEDLADCATDDLTGWVERKKDKSSEPVRHAGILDGVEMSRADAEDLIMTARVEAGWISPEDLAPAEEAAGEEVEDAEAADADADVEATTTETATTEDATGEQPAGIGGDDTTQNSAS